MKRFLTIVGLCCVALSVSARSFNRLWKDYEKAVEADQPQTAFAVTQQILQKALQEQQQGQFLSASLAATAMQHQWMPENFFLDVDSLEKMRARETDPALKAIEASILAGVYLNNCYRAAEAFDSAAYSNILLSLQQPEMLAIVPSERYLPFVVQSSLSKYYHHDLLHVLWQRFRDFCQYSRRVPATVKDSVYAAVKAVYEVQHNDNALLLMGLDMDQDPQQLLQQYPEVRTGAEAYIKLLTSRETDSLKVVWARTALKRYPRYERIGVVQQIYNELREPRVEIRFPSIPYPGKNYSLSLRYKNVQKIKGEVLLLPDEFDNNSLYDGKTTPIEKLKKIGVCVDKIAYQFKHVDEYQYLKDSLMWTAPTPGHYAFIFETSTKASFTNHRKSEPSFELFTVSSMQLLQSVIEKKLHFIAVDAQTGRPLPDVAVSLYQIQKNSERKLVKQATTDSQGTFSCDSLQGSYTIVAQRGAHDCIDNSFYIHGKPVIREDKSSFNLHFYTDRAVYYPGHTVHLGGVAYCSEGAKSMAVPDTTLTLELKDANGASVSTQQVSSDEFGTFAADFKLPSKGLPGYYTVLTDKASTSFQVQEYQRPTFEIKMKPDCEVDTVHKVVRFIGSVMKLNGVPMRQQLVEARFNNPVQPDTVFTDSLGVFVYEYPITKLEDNNSSLQHLHLQVLVQASTGETHEASATSYWNNKPLRLSIKAPFQQVREYLEPITFQLTGRTNQSLDGILQWKIYAVKVGEATQEVPLLQGLMSTSTNDHSLNARTSSSTFPTEALRTLPGGTYQIYVFAQAGSDTVSAVKKFYISSLNDKKLPFHRDLWLYAPQKKWKDGKPLCVQVGTSLKDATLFCETITAKGKITHQTYELSDSLLLLSFPYDSSYGERLKVSFEIVHNEKATSRYCFLVREDERENLRATWTTFRDHAQPGENTTWKLRLTHADGSPASAQLMCTLYDAALDVWSGRTHSWSPLIFDSYVYFPSAYSNQIGRHSITSVLYFPLKVPKHLDADFDAFNSQWAGGLDYSIRPSHPYRFSKAALGVSNDFLEEEAVYYSVDAGLQGRVAGLDATTETETVSVTALRKNFDETAYFAPRLVADAKGEVTLNFTLPESLTSWHFLGMAHTRDIKYAMLDTLVVAQKTLMVQCYAPQFVRQGDKVKLRGTIQNLSAETQSGNATWELINPLNNKIVVSKKVSFSTTGNSDETVDFSFTVPENLSLLTLRFSAASKNFSDGESHDVAVLPVTAVTPLIPTIYAPKPTLTDSLMKLSPLSTKCEDVLSVARCLGSNLLGRQWVEQRKDVQDLLNKWKKQAAQNPDVLMGRLQQNEILWDILLSETPFLPAAQRETEARHELLQLLDAYNLHHSIVELTEKLSALQHTDGGFSWYPGMSSNVYVTHEVVQHLSAVRYDNDAVAQLIERAESFLKAKNYKPSNPRVRHLNPAINNPGATQKAMELTVNAVRKNGHEIVTRYLITVHRDLQFVRLSAPRAANVSVQDTQSGYRYQGGLGYYRACHTASTDYYFEHLPQGVYQIEERTYEEREGEYHSGTPALQSLYEVP